ncbi:MAG: endonuclease/exonuclease/phosphatase family protein [Planctomycetota bacterium]
MRHHPIAIALLVASGLAVGACSSSNAGNGSRSAASRPIALTGAKHDAAIMVDGVVDDWPLESVMTGDDEHLYLRFLLEGQPRTLQANDETVSIRLDLDDSTETGRVFSDPIESTTLGVDLEILLSPPGDDGQPQGGARLVAYDEDGEASPVGHADVGFHFAPTFASTWFEARLSRHMDGDVQLPDLSDEGEGAGMVVVMGPSGVAEAWSAPFRGEWPQRSRTQKLADVSIPPKPTGAVRVVCWNVYFTQPATNPQPFARVLRSLDPDVVLLQEWDIDDSTHIASWFNALLPRQDGWQALTGESWGVAVVTPHTLSPLGDNVLYLSEGDERAVNLVAAVVNTPSGRVAASSVHLKCCGGPDGPEEARRLAEADAINATLAEQFEATPTDMRIVAGDLNLVGAVGPLDRLRTGLDADGSDLAVARTSRLGDAAMYTWRDEDSAFTPGRLDYALVGDSEAELVQAFVLDVDQLTPNAVQAAGLRPGDTAASDHLPLVIDIRPR